MGAIGVLHSGEVALIVSPAGTGSVTGVDIAASIIFNRLPGSSLPTSVVARSKWPNGIGRSFWGECYSLLFELDMEISKVYNQVSLSK